jgi:hypothetical protein
MSADGVREHDLTRAAVFVLGLGLGLAAIAGFLAYAQVAEVRAGRTPVAVAGVVALLAIFLALVPRRLVRRARIERGRLRARTLTGEHDVDLADLTDLDWNTATYGLPFGQIRYPGGHLVVPGAGAERLMGELEQTRPDLAAKGSRRTRR